jgi:SAM-dependent methyltransferase
MNLHYGCGLTYAADWFNCDSSPALRLQRLPLAGLIFRHYLAPRFPSEIAYGDIVNGLSLAPDSCDAIYCSHVLEHLSLEDLRRALRNTHLYLKPGGIFRLVLPDFDQQIAAYQENSDPKALSDFMTYSGLGRATRPKGIGARLREYFGNSHHLWAWNYPSLARELEGVGFRGMRRCEFGDALNPAFKSVENPERFQWALAIECTK